MFLQFLVDILPLGSGSVDPHIFADPDPGSQNLTDPTDPDPTALLKKTLYFLHVIFIMALSNYSELLLFSVTALKSEFRAKHDPI